MLNLWVFIFYFYSLCVAFTATFMWFLMCWLPQLSNQLGYMFALIFGIYASAMFFCAHQLLYQLNAGKEKRGMKFCPIYALVGSSQEKKYQFLIIWLLGLIQRLSFCFWYCFVYLFLFCKNEKHKIWNLISCNPILSFVGDELECYCFCFVLEWLSLFYKMMKLSYLKAKGK